LGACHANAGQAALGRLLRSEMARYEAVVKAANIRLD